MQYWRSIDDVRAHYDVGDKSLNGYEHNLLFRNDGVADAADDDAVAPVVFTEIGFVSGCDSVQDGRGVAAGDLDDDGDLDLVVTSLRQPLVCYDNAGNENHWLQVRLVGESVNRPAVGARVVVEAGGRRQVREVRGGCGFLSQGSLWPSFGLGAATVADSVAIHWPARRGANGVLTRPITFIHDVPADSILTAGLEEGSFDIRQGASSDPRPAPAPSRERPTDRRSPR